MASGSDGWRPAFSFVGGLFLSAGRVGTLSSSYGWLASPTPLASIRGCVRDQVYITGSSHDGWFVRNRQSSDINHSLKWLRKSSDRVRRDGKSLSHNKSPLLLILTKDPQNILRTPICSNELPENANLPPWLPAQRAIGLSIQWESSVELKITWVKLWALKKRRVCNPWP